MSDMICAECGHSNDDAVDVCAKCGAPLSAEGGAGDWLSLVEASETPEPSEIHQTSETPSAVDSSLTIPPASLNPSHEFQGDAVGAPLDNSEGEGEIAASEDRNQKDGAEVAEQDPPQARRTLLPFLLFGALIAALIGAYVGWSMFGQSPQMAEVADAPEAAAPADTRPQWQINYADAFLSPDTVIMTVAAEAKQRDLPSTDGTVVARERREGEMVSGRWVRGADGTSRWLKLSDGGYVWDGNLATPGGPGSPIAIPFSNRDTSFGPEIGRYLDEARRIAQARYARAETMPPKERQAYLDEIETAATFAPVPNRRFHGLTVAAVGQYYEGSAIIFREREAAVIAALRAAGVVIHDDGSIPLAGDEAESCSVGVFTPEAREPQYGASQLSCGL
ncbi:MAG: hypothetical protein ABL909_05490 [Sphingopyxis sp.]